MSEYKRVIPCLDIAGGRVVKGVHFVGLRDVGDPAEAARAYSQAGADELVMLDIHATNESRATLLELVGKVAAAATVPFAVGGGISTVEQMETILRMGAAKVSVNSAAVARPALIAEAAARFGSARVVVAIDVKARPGGGWDVYTHGGKTNTGRDAVAWAREVEALGAGEILLTSMDGDGALTGYDVGVTCAVADAVSIPVVASGGAGTLAHFYEGIAQGHADAVLGASVFHFGTHTVAQVKEYLRERGVPVRLP